MFNCSHIHVLCLTTDCSPICRPHSDPVGCSWFQTIKLDTSVVPSHNPLILWSHHWRVSKVQSLIAHIVSCSIQHLGPGDTHWCSCSSSSCDGGGWLQDRVFYNMKQKQTCILLRHICMLAPCLKCNRTFLSSVNTTWDHCMMIEKNVMFPAQSKQAQSQSSSGGRQQSLACGSTPFNNRTKVQSNQSTIL